jgi:tetratricopeptide (TPR) repeat protein/S1-C subfamily serine protease
MYHFPWYCITVLFGVTVALIQSPALAKSESDVEAIARSVLVEIRLQQKAGVVGSGVIVHRRGNLYTLVTNGHVVCGINHQQGKLCNALPTAEIYNLSLADGQRYQVKVSGVKLLGQKLDLAIIQFRSNRNYAVAKLSAPGSLKAKNELYTAGFPLTLPGFSLGKGQAIAVVNKRLTADGGGYTVVYNAPTLPGMSGGGVFNRNGQLVAIHGQGDVFRNNTDPDNKSRLGSKIGYNRGIPVRWVVKSLGEIGINFGRNTNPIIRHTPLQLPISADEYLISGFNIFVEPGANILSGKQQAIQEFSQAIQLNPKYEYAYLLRAAAYQQIQEFQKSLIDYNEVIAINPRYAEAYNNRAILKKERLNDLPGALLDYNQAIAINPKYSEAYYNRALLKAEKLNDLPGALADYNEAIAINSKHYLAYNNRALLKAEKLNDLPGALADYNEAIAINSEYAEAYNNRAVLKKSKLNELLGALADYNKAIAINPRCTEAYYNRAILKHTKLNDFQGALVDYDEAIAINPRYTEAYYNRAILKHTKLNDFQGALVDYNEAIAIDPKHAEAYYNRTILQRDRPGGDRPGAIPDFRQAARLFREQGRTRVLQLAIAQLQKLGATE